MESIGAAASSGVYSTTVTTYTWIDTETLPAYSLSIYPGGSYINSVTILTSGDLTTTIDHYTVYSESYAYSTSYFTSTVLIGTDTYTLPETPSFTLPSPTCSLVENTFPVTTGTPRSGSSCGMCTLGAADVQLIYWPVETAPGNISSTITRTATDIPTGVYNGTAYPSGSVYLKYDRVSAIDGCGNNVGNIYPGAVVTLASNEVSSLIGDGTYFHSAETFNYANLNYPTPWSVYVQMMGCQVRAAIGRQICIS